MGTIKRFEDIECWQVARILVKQIYELTRKEGWVEDEKTTCFRKEDNWRFLTMEGIQYVTNAKGQKVAVQIDLKKFGELWEDFYDNVVAKQRENEPRESIDAVRERLRKQRKLNV